MPIIHAQVAVAFAFTYLNTYRVLIILTAPPNHTEHGDYLLWLDSRHLFDLWYVILMQSRECIQDNISEFCPTKWLLLRRCHGSGIRHHSLSSASLHPPKIPFYEKAYYVVQLSSWLVMNFAISSFVICHKCNYAKCIYYCRIFLHGRGKIYTLISQTIWWIHG